ncbi:hypothetical protein [Jonesia denitrificans]|uniref:Uncharacterized protein n=1 Tax=Jonesia denitrificans (strain ATCC 14870 / DSM 20603 / BCRC 15368 / CIP 55.134 / JCM 11481 / NBRC 15587 / NCTC 10816 / Prevot 55134) TaxID=471856 RepID=C7R270_JONDD|nr:hypothetical protein [Jonesia denitrificans]ACV09958.1 hypothetical protein Jden_2323 [Jonesia denitrificans DSM 20603]ASE08803.1 hypothetical protein CEP80_06400 [Jonesia denitrificans]ASE08860.1 hypothetical protein CEP80_06700 [Jonesia denitrificans]QXB43409.1 hypothetical protein I6L70_00365 [Jonesia denitrificans]SQH22731.1 Uncharacterised protein [Jonesia denitrificans]
MRYETIATLANETYVITPLEEGQALHFNGNRYTGPVGEPIRVYGTGPVEISQGKWGNRLRATGKYDGPYFDGYTPSTVPAEFLTLQRSIDGSPWVTLAEDIQLDGAVTDPIPALAGTNTYRAVSKTVLPTSANGPNVDYQINEPKWHYINTGPHMSEVYRVYGNPNLSRQHSRNRATIHMAGRANPITITGENRSSTYTLTAQLTPDATPPNQWENLEWTPDPICYRDPSGQRILGTVNGTELTGSKWPEVSVAFTKTDYQEEEIYE